MSEPLKHGVFTVSQVNRYIKRLLAEDALLSGVFIVGELSNVKPHGSGHLYFTLKDENAGISGVMFKSHAQGLTFEPQNGMKAVVGGYISLYEKTGQYQVYAEYMEPAGIGGLQAAFLQLREKLEAEGLFDPSRKRALPRYADTVAVITSPTGAVFWDITRIVRERNPGVKIIIVPAQVQGEGAAAALARAVKQVNAYGKADVIILARGGGSMEDLRPFNEEITARAVAASRIPVISAVGHETDFTICDFAADTRAPTPTAAAAMAVFSREDALRRVASLTEYLRRNTRVLFESYKNKYTALAARRCLKQPLELVYQRQAHIENLLKALTRSITERVAREKLRLGSQTALLEGKSPYAAWGRGFAAVSKINGEAVTSVGVLSEGERVNLRFKDGAAQADIARIKGVL